MYSEGSRNRHLLKDEGYDDASGTEIIAATAEELFQLCGQQSMTTSSYGTTAHHYFTAPVQSLGAAVAQGLGGNSWKRTFIIDQQLNAEINAQPFMSVWIGGENTQTQAHYDVLDNIFVQAYGTKTFKFWPIQEFVRLKVFPDIHPRARKSQLSQLSDTFPESALEITLEAGEGLYIPAFYFHHVRAIKGISISLNCFSSCSLNLCGSRILSFPFPFANISNLDDLNRDSNSDSNISFDAVHRLADVLEFVINDIKHTLVPASQIISPAHFIESVVLSRFLLLKSNHTTSAMPVNGSDILFSARIRANITDDQLSALQQLSILFKELHTVASATRPSEDVNGLITCILSHLTEKFALEICRKPYQVLFD
jgi:hypothetical protein